MKIFDKKSLTKIEDDDLKDAKLSSMDIFDEETKKRAYINILGARLAMKMLFSQKIEANNLYSLYTIQNVLEEIDIADIYFKGIKIDARLVFNQEEIFIPKSHFEYNLVPDLYLVLNLKEDLSSAEFLGFFEPKDLNKKNANEKFYFFEYENLQKPDKLKSFLEKYEEKKDFQLPQENFEKAEELLLALADKEISEQDKHLLFKMLSDSFALREKAVEFENFEVLSKKVAKNDKLAQDDVLSIVGSQKLYEDETETLPEEVELQPDETLEEPFVGDEDATPESLDEQETILPEDMPLFVDSQDEGEVIPAYLKDSELILPANIPVFADSQDEEEVIPSYMKDPSALIQDEQEVQDYNPIDSDENELDSADEGLSIPFRAVENDESTLATDDENAFGELPAIFEEEDENQGKQQSLEYKQETVSLDTFDFDMLNDELEKTEEKSIVSDDDLLFLESEEDEPHETKTNGAMLQAKGEDDSEFDLLRAFSDLEESEDEKPASEKEDYKKPTLHHDELISQLDEFLSEAEGSPKSENLLKGISAFKDDTEAILSEVSSDGSDIVYFQKEEDEAESPVSIIQNDETKAEPNPNKDLIQALFEKEKLAEAANSQGAEIEANEEKMKLPFELTKNKKLIIAASLSVAVLAAIAIGGNVAQNKSKNIIVRQDTINSSALPPQGQSSEGGAQGDEMNPPTLNQDGVQTQDLAAGQGFSGAGQQVQGGRDMGRAVSDGFTSEPVSTTISKVAWEVPEELAYNDSFRKYLQIAGKSLKLNLQNNLLLANEMAYSNKVIVDLTISRDGSLQSSDISLSSGSKQIDKIVLQSVKETLKYLKMPSNELSGQSAVATLIISF